MGMKNGLLHDVHVFFCFFMMLTRPCHGPGPCRADPPLAPAAAPLAAPGPFTVTGRPRGGLPHE
jgi:hypothetical protein